MSLLEIRNLKKSFDGLSVINDISLFVEEGEVVAIIGPSGSGKSTLLRCATLLEKMDEGTLKICGKSATKNEFGKTEYVSKKEIKDVKKSFGLVFQSFNLFPHYSVIKNVYDAVVSVYKVDKKKAIEDAKELLKKVGLEGKENNYPCQLSGGQKQRVAIARALALNPKILFFDEPTSALDPELTAEILNVMRELVKEKMTMVVVTHEIEFARQVADRVVFVDGGYIIEEGSPEEVIDNPANERTKAFLKKLL